MSFLSKLSFYPRGNLLLPDWERATAATNEIVIVRADLIISSSLFLIVQRDDQNTRKHYSSEKKIRIALDSLYGEDSIAELCRRDGISQGNYYKWSKDFMETGKRHD